MALSFGSRGGLSGVTGKCGVTQATVELRPWPSAITQNLRPRR